MRHEAAGTDLQTGRRAAGLPGGCREQRVLLRVSVSVVGDVLGQGHTDALQNTALCLHTGQVGVDGGEVVINTPLPAISDAIYNAIGTRFYELPITPEQIAMAVAAKQ